MATRILIIDGDISLSTVLSDYLASRGYKAQAVGNGKAGLDALSAGHWDLILMELQGVEMNGFELLKTIRHRLPNIPLIVLTSRNDRESQMRAFQLGCDDYQTKPSRWIFSFAAWRLFYVVFGHFRRANRRSLT